MAPRAQLGGDRRVGAHVVAGAPIWWWETLGSGVLIGAGLMLCVLVISSRFAGGSNKL